MAKIVRYNGGTQSYYPCTLPEELEFGRLYEVTNIRMADCHTEYTLKGEEGEFNSVWFQEIPSPTYYQAVSRGIPVVGESYFCLRTIKKGTEWINESVATSTVTEVQQISATKYVVATLNSVYIVEII